MPSRQSYPISILFIVVAVCAILLSIGYGHFSLGDITAEGVQQVIGFSFVMCLVGALVGLHSYRRRRGLYRGGIVGMLLGLVIGPTMFLRDGDLTRIVTLEVLGSFALVVLGILARVAKSDPLWQALPPIDKTIDERPA